MRSGRLPIGGSIDSHRDDEGCLPYHHFDSMEIAAAWPSSRTGATWWSPKPEHHVGLVWFSPPALENILHGTFVTAICSPPTKSYATAETLLSRSANSTTRPARPTPP